MDGKRRPEPHHTVDAQTRSEPRGGPHREHGAEVQEVEDAEDAAKARHPVEADGAAKPNAGTNFFQSMLGKNENYEKTFSKMFKKQNLKLKELNSECMIF